MGGTGCNHDKTTGGTYTMSKKSMGGAKKKSARKTSKKLKKNKKSKAGKKSKKSFLARLFKL